MVHSVPVRRTKDLDSPIVFELSAVGLLGTLHSGGIWCMARQLRGPFSFFFFFFFQKALFGGACKKLSPSCLKRLPTAFSCFSCCFNELSSPKKEEEG